jgi:hypothetical protein
MFKLSERIKLVDDMTYTWAEKEYGVQWAYENLTGHQLEIDLEGDEADCLMQP